MRSGLKKRKYSFERIQKTPIFHPERISKLNISYNFSLIFKLSGIS
jgi:hypothetical protein